jgi:hypothetical protein
MNNAALCALAIMSLAGCQTCNDLPIGTPIEITVRDTTTEALVGDAVVTCAFGGSDAPSTATSSSVGHYLCGFEPGTYAITVVWNGSVAAQQNVVIPGASQSGGCPQSPPPVEVTIHIDATRMEPGGAPDASVGDAGR